MNTPLRCLMLLPLLLAVHTAQGATTDLADVPLFTSSSSAVKPNILFILDNSGSMGSTYLPDDANFSSAKYGKPSAQCNGLAYNPAVSYAPPVDSLGNSAANGGMASLSPDPNVRTTNKRTLETPSISIVAAGPIAVVLPAAPAPQASWYANGTVVTVFSGGDTSRYMEGTVTGWNAGTRTLSINVASAVGSGVTIAGLIVGNGGMPFYYKYKGVEPSLGYTYTASGVIKTTVFYKECDSAVGAAPGSGVFDKVIVTTASTDAQNYANWNAYYVTRMLMMKASVSLAFKDIGDRYRVGYTTISDRTATAGTNFLDVETFDASQKNLFYTKLAAASPGGYTPLRGALSKAGQYFAKRAPGQTKDPVQYSCQKNFTILSTDGYWNTTAETSTYGPNDVAGVAVGQQDATPTARPMRDGADPTTTTVTTWTSTRTLLTQAATTTTTYDNPRVTVSGSYGNGSGSRRDTYSGATANGQLLRCAALASGKCTVTATVTGHGYNSGDWVTISGASPNTYNGSYQIVRLTADTFTYLLSSRPTKDADGTGGTNPGNNAARGSCSAGRGSYTQTRVQTDTYPLTLSSVTTSDTTITTRYTLTQTVTATPYTQTVVVVNGATTSDTTATGTPTVTTTTPPPPADLVSVGSYSSTPSASGGPSAVIVTNTSATVCATSQPSNATSSGAVVSTKPSYSPVSTATTLASKTGAPVTTTASDNTVAGTKSATSTDSVTGGAPDTLADIAMYYYATDLRTPALGNCTGALGAGSSVCKTLDAGGSDTNVTQNMQTFTLGLGVNGTLKYSTDYLENPKNSDFFALTQGTKKWPNPTVSSGGGDPTNIDDLWHAAVNGRGQFFSAGDPTAVVASLQSALKKITEIKGSAAAAATSTLQPVDGDNDIFVAQFTSGKWIGDVQKFSINPSTGEVSDTAVWSAADVLNARIAASTTRTVYYFKKGSGNTGSLRAFSHANLSTDGLGGNFDNFCAKPGAGGAAAPGQCSTLSVADKATANAGTSLVSYLLGSASPVYRARTSALGDIINSSPIYAGAPKYKYTENGYAAFASTKASRAGLLYVGANDGMLHAFDRVSGEEKWAYVPSAVLPNLYKLADTDYEFNHQFYVDGSPRVGDVWDGSKWRTILVGGMNKGGKMVYALDVTDPESPVALWEFTHPNLGLTFGNPVITKRSDGTWVVVFASGYNNVGTGDGNGHLYVVDAISGESVAGPVATYTGGSTPAGTTTTPSGLAKINAFVTSEIDNTARIFYGGDLLGNVWRFDIDSNVAPYGKAFLLAQLIAGGVPQPVTTKPEIAELNYQGSKIAVVYVGTGKYLGTSDLSNADLQSIHALKDDFSQTGLGDVISRTDVVKQTITTATNAAGESIRKSSGDAVDWSLKKGWRIDLPSTGERINVNMILALNVLSVASNVPTSDVCDAGGRSWLYKFDIGTGGAVSNAADSAVGISLGNVLVAGQTVVQLPDGRTVTITTLSNTAVRTDRQPAPPVTGLLRRTSWRELAN